MNDIREKTAELAELLKASEEYADFRQAAESVNRSASGAALLAEYRRLRQKLQAAELSGADCAEELEKLQKLGELLQMDPVTSEYLFAEYRLNGLLAGIYKDLAGAIGADLGLAD